MGARTGDFFVWSDSRFVFVPWIRKSAVEELYYSNCYHHHDKRENDDDGYLYY